MIIIFLHSWVQLEAKLLNNGQPNIHAPFTLHLTINDNTMITKYDYTLKK